MNKKDLLNGVIAGLNGAITTPQALTTQAVNLVIHSDPVKSTIRKMILDPIQSHMIPKLRYNTYFTIIYAVYALLEIAPDGVMEDLLDITEQKRKEEFVARIAENSTPTDLYYYLPDTDPKHPRTVIIKCGSSFIYITYEDYNTREYKNTELVVHFVGPTAKKLYNEFQEKCSAWENYLTEGVKDRFKQEIRVLVFDNDGGRRPNSKKCTVPDTIIVDHVKSDLDQIIATVKSADSVTRDFKINKSTGVLLYGPHGTGKSTLVRYLAMELKRDILLVTSDNLDDAVRFIQDRSKGMDTTDRNQYIMLIEDIDFKFTDRRKRGKDEEANSDMMKKTDTLFQVLDGVLGESNILICATTNYFDRLDPALIRDGRFDFRIEVNGLDYDTAAKVCERFHVDPHEIKLSEWELPISPASLQTFLLKYLVRKNSGSDTEMMFKNLPEGVKPEEPPKEETPKKKTTSKTKNTEE